METVNSCGRYYLGSNEPKGAVDIFTFWKPSCARARVAVSRKRGLSTALNLNIYRKLPQTRQFSPLVDEDVPGLLTVLCARPRDVAILRERTGRWVPLHEPIGPAALLSVLDAMDVQDDLRALKRALKELRTGRPDERAS